MVCKYCGTYVEGNAKFCPKCGNMIEIQPQPEQQYRGGNGYQEKTNNNALVVSLIVVAALLVLLISVVFAFMWMGGGKNEPTPTQVPSPTPTISAPPISTPTPTPIPTPTPAPIERHKVFKADITWEQANQNALSYGGYLVYVNNAEEFGRVCALANSMNLKAFWLGASRASGQSWNAVRWGDGSYMNYTYWYKNEPTMYDSYGNEERYLMAFKVNGVWYFNDSVNNVNNAYPGGIGYIVEYE